MNSLDLALSTRIWVGRDHNTKHCHTKHHMWNNQLEVYTVIPMPIKFSQTGHPLIFWISNPSGSTSTKDPKQWCPMASMVRFLGLWLWFILYIWTYMDASWNGGIPDNPQIIHFNGMVPRQKNNHLFFWWLCLKIATPSSKGIQTHVGWDRMGWHRNPTYNFRGTLHDPR